MHVWKISPESWPSAERTYTDNSWGCKARWVYFNWRSRRRRNLRRFDVCMPVFWEQLDVFMPQIFWRQHLSLVLHLFIFAREIICVRRMIADALRQLDASVHVKCVCFNAKWLLKPQPSSTQKHHSKCVLQTRLNFTTQCRACASQWAGNGTWQMTRVHTRSYFPFMFRHIHAGYSLWLRQFVNCSSHYWAYYLRLHIWTCSMVPFPLT